MNFFIWGVFFALLQTGWGETAPAEAIQSGLTISNTTPRQENSSGLKIASPDSTNPVLERSPRIARMRKIDPSARPLLEEVQKSYKNLKSADLSGVFSITINTTGGMHSVVRSFSSSFQRPNLFRHQMQPNVLLGCDGKGGYAFDQQENAYLRFQYPNTNQFHLKMPSGVMSTLLLQNPSLLFALSDIGLMDAMEGFGDIKRVGDRNINGTVCPVLKFGSETDPNSVQIAFDPATHLIRQFTLNIRSEFAQNGKITPGQAAILVEYKNISSEPTFSADHFVWTPPPGAKDVLEAAGAEP